jgi:two-component system C4-dicarboxylate transport response regulator DctD
VQLLRVLDDGVVQPLGSDRPRTVDIRLVCASNVDLRYEVRRGAIREDFYHRIVVLSIMVPPLRERVEDIALLVSHFLRLAADRSGIAVPTVPEATLAEMTRHQWPGNVRELKNAVERLVITAHAGTAGGFTTDMHFDSERLLSLPAGTGRLRDEMERVEKSAIEGALKECRGEINATWQALGISRRALYERMKTYGLDRESCRQVR